MERTVFFVGWGAFFLFVLLSCLAQGHIGRVLIGLGMGAVLLAAVWAAMPEDSKGRFRSQNQSWLWDE